VNAGADRITTVAITIATATGEAEIVIGVGPETVTSLSILQSDRECRSFLMTDSAREIAHIDQAPRDVI
jgi:hypothetical protein